MNLIKTREVLRLDLKDSGSLWSDGELNRCVIRTYDDISRYLPLECIYEETLKFAVSGESITSPATTNLTAIVNAQSIDVAGGSYLTVAGQPDVPRTLRITITDADNSTYEASFIITGLDKDSKAISETFHFSRGGSKTINGVKEFKQVYDVELDSDYGSHSPDVASVGYGLFTDPYIYLAYKPIRPKSETVTNAAGTVTYTRGTDYVMDYINGRVKLIAGGSMLASTAYLASYTKSRLGINVASLMPIVTRLVRVEYPSDKIPQQFASFSVFGDFMYIGSIITNKNQEEMSDSEHVTIYYERKHNPPGEIGDGSLPELMDEVVCLGAQAYALMMKSLQYEYQAVTDLVTMRTAISNIATAIGKANTATTGPHALAITALANAGTNFADSIIGAQYGSHNDDSGLIGIAIVRAKGILAYCQPTDGAGIHTKIRTALDAIATAIGTVTTYLTGTSDPSIFKYLTDGDAYINATNKGADVGATFAKYAEECGVLSNGILSKANAYANEAVARLKEVEDTITEANGYFKEAEVRFAVSDKLQGAGSGYLLRRTRRRFWL